MIGYLKGNIKAKTEKTLLIDVKGVGYSIFTTAALIQESKVGQEIEIYTHTYVREDVLEIYGLASQEEIEFFKKLITISGVGPKSALGIFEVAKLEDLKKAIANGDASLLTKVSGIGKKTAELIVVKLKDKNIELTDTESLGAAGEAIDALMGLGYSAADARAALNQITPDITLTEDKVKAALKLLSK